MRLSLLVLLLPFLALLVSPPLRAQEGPTTPDAAGIYGDWLQKYSEGKLFLIRDGVLDRQEMKRFRRIFADVAQSQDLVAAKLLWQAAIVELPPELDKFQRLEAQLAAVRGEAKGRIAGIAGKDVDDWLLEIALRRGGRSGSLPRVTALEILGQRENRELGKEILDKLRRFPADERVQALIALEQLGSLEEIPELLKMLRNREPNMRIATVTAIAGILAPHSDETKSENVKEDAPGVKLAPEVVDALAQVYRKEKNWQVRAAIVDAMQRLRSRHAIPALIQAMRDEKAVERKRGAIGHQMLLGRIHDALVGLTGQDLPPNAPELWQSFWDREGAKFRFATDNGPRAQSDKKKRPEGGSYVKYFNLDIRSKRILFIIDFSGSMREPVKLEGRYAGIGAKQPKYELVKKELEKVIRALPRDTVCNVVFFSNEAMVWRIGKGSRPELVPMKDSNKAALLQYVYETAPGGSTNLFGALEVALAMGERGVYDKYYATAFDSIYLLSDGAPSSGKIVETKSILAEVDKINKLRRISINTIVFGNESNNLTFMRQLAERNRGDFIHVK
jgi:hypothetical protein